MVYYYTSNLVSPSAFIYAGKDKFESEYDILPYRNSDADYITDEELIKYGWEEDVW